MINNETFYSTIPLKAELVLSDFEDKINEWSNTIATCKDKAKFNKELKVIEKALKTTNDDITLLNNKQFELSNLSIFANTDAELLEKTKYLRFVSYSETIPLIIIDKYIANLYSIASGLELYESVLLQSVYLFNDLAYSLYNQAVEMNEEVLYKGNK